MEQLNPNQEGALKFVIEHPLSSIEDIAAGAKISNRLIAVSAVKHLTALKLIVPEEKNGQPVYSSVGNPKADKVKSIAVTDKPALEKKMEKPKAEKAKKAAPKEQEIKVATKNNQKSSRSLARHRFAGEEYNQSRYALEVCKHNFPKLTMAKLDEIFGEVKMSYGLYAPIARAVEVSQDRKRFFLDIVVVTKDAKKLHISNQFTASLLTVFIKFCTKAGLKIK